MWFRPYHPLSRILLAACAACLFLTLNSCGGGGSSNGPPPPPAGSFALQVTPSMLAVIAGDSVQGTVSIQAQNGFSGSVALSISGLPGGVAASFTSNPILPNQTADLIIQTNTNTAVQNASLQIQGMSGSVSNKLTASLSVLARPLG